MIAKGPGEERKELSVEDGSCFREGSGREAGRSSLGVGRWKRWTQEAEEEGVSRDRKSAERHSWKRAGMEEGAADSVRK